jgi:hypothetical protein
MDAVDQIVATARRLTPAQFHILRRKLDGLEEQLWKEEQARAAESLKKRGITDGYIDRMVLKRRTSRARK